jgi:hypothetical protein
MLPHRAISDRMNDDRLLYGMTISYMRRIRWIMKSNLTVFRMMISYWLLHGMTRTYMMI